MMEKGVGRTGRGEIRARCVCQCTGQKGVRVKKTTKTSLTSLESHFRAHTTPEMNRFKTSCLLTWSEAGTNLVLLF